MADKKNHKITSKPLLNEIVERQRAKADYTGFLQEQVKTLKDAFIEYFGKDLFTGNASFAALTLEKKIEKTLDKAIKGFGYDYKNADLEVLRLLNNCENVSRYFQSTEAEKIRYQTIVKLREYREKLCIEKGLIQPGEVITPSAPAISQAASTVTQVRPVNVSAKPQASVASVSTNARNIPNTQEGYVYKETAPSAPSFPESANVINQVSFANVAKPQTGILAANDNKYSPTKSLSSTSSEGGYSPKSSLFSAAPAAYDAVNGNNQSSFRPNVAHQDYSRQVEGTPQAKAQRTRSCQIL